MIAKLLTEHHLEFLSLKGGCRGSSESTNVKMPHCWKSCALSQFFSLFGSMEYTAKVPVYLFFYFYFIWIYGIYYLWDTLSGLKLRVSNEN